MNWSWSELGTGARRGFALTGIKVMKGISVDLSYPLHHLYPCKFNSLTRRDCSMNKLRAARLPQSLSLDPETKSKRRVSAAVVVPDRDLVKSRP